MQPLELTLIGFRGVRDGLGRDELTIDFGAFAGAQLIAVTGANGRGKTTVLDNAHPYLVMPSHVKGSAYGGFSYYEHVVLPESQKIFTWQQSGTRYRSHVVIRSNGKRKTEAYLQVWRGGRWQPMVAPDGTVSDGKTSTHNRCLAQVATTPETFFTTAFSAQGRRHLSAYDHAEIKTLLAELLQLDHIRTLGGQANEIVRQARSGLLAIRQQRTAAESQLAGIQADMVRSTSLQANLARLQAERQRGEAALARAQGMLSESCAQRDAMQQQEARRAQLIEERGEIIARGRRVVTDLDQQKVREQERLRVIAQRAAQAGAVAERQRERLLVQQTQLAASLRSGRFVARATRRLPKLQALVRQRGDAVAQLRLETERLRQVQSDAVAVRQQIAMLEQAAGNAVLRTEELARRFGLTTQVPCAGTVLQARCMLLGDAHAAAPLILSARAELVRLDGARQARSDELAALHDAAALLADTPVQLAAVESKLGMVRAKLAWEAQLAARAGEMANAKSTLASVAEQLEQLARTQESGRTAAAVEQASATAALTSASERRALEAQAHRASLDRVQALIDALPPPFDPGRVATARQDLEQCREALGQLEQQYLAAVRAEQQLRDARVRQNEATSVITGLDQRIARIEAAIGGWSLFAKCMSNDGLIALAIDDAGPALSNLTNDLLLACHGARFTVSIKTQVEKNAKGELGEGFAIVVHDGLNDDSKSVTLMSGGEKIWINECLTRAMALYLAQRADAVDGAGRSDTLFSDEADGAFDPGHKRAFMAMKREVLRLGGYHREFFISHTPELLEMADALLDLDRLAANGHAPPTREETGVDGVRA